MIEIKTTVLTSEHMLKAQAASLVKYLEQKQGYRLGQTHSQHAIAFMYGYENWQTLKDALNKG